MQIIETKEFVVFQEITESFETNAILLLLPLNNIIVDTLAHPDQAAAIVNYLGSKNRNQLPTWVINTHYHWDHIWGNQLFKECIIIAHDACRQKVMQEGLEVLDRFKQKNSYYESVELVSPNLTFSNTMTLNAEAEMPVEVCHFSSHSFDSAYVYLPNQQILVAGDILEDPFPLLERENGTQEYLTGLKKLMQKPIKTIIPGHGQVSGKELLENNYHYISTVWETACEAVKKDIPVERLFDKPLTDFSLMPINQAYVDFYIEGHKDNIKRAYLDIVSYNLLKSKSFNRI